MNIIGNMGKNAGKAFSGIGKMMNPPKKAKLLEPKNFLHESAEDYAERLMIRRSNRH